jgi:hypothetical protein
MIVIGRRDGWHEDNGAALIRETRTMMPTDNYFVSSLLSVVRAM